MWLADECHRPAVTFLEGLSPTRWLLAFLVFFALKQQASALTLGPWHLSDTGGEIDGTYAPERRSDDCPMLLGCWLVVHILWEFSSDEKESDGVISPGNCFEMGPAPFLGRLQLAAACGLNYSALFESKDKQDLNWPQRKPQSGLKKKMVKGHCFHLQLTSEPVCFSTPFMSFIPLFQIHFFTPSSPGPELKIGKKEAGHFSEAQQPPLEGKKRLTHGMKLRNGGPLSGPAESGG